MTLPNFDKSEVGASLKAEDEESSHLCYSLIDPELMWETLRWVQGVTKLPALVKGMLAAGDALESSQIQAVKLMVPLTFSYKNEVQGAPCM